MDRFLLWMNKFEFESIALKVESYDLAADDDEDMLLTRPCLRDLIKRSGAIPGKG